MGLIRGVFLGCALAAAIGCAKDMNQKDFQNQDALNDLAKFQAVAGVYTGLLRNEKGMPLGGVELTIEASLTSQNGSGLGQSGTTSAMTPTLSTQLRFRDKVTLATVRTASGYFEPNSGIYVADFIIELPDSAGKSSTQRQLKLTGNIADGHVRGTMQGVGFPSQKAGFDALKNGTSIENLAKEAKPIPGSLPEGVAVKFSGKVVLPPAVDPDCVPTKKKKCLPVSKTEGISMRALFPIKNSDEHFANIFLPDNSKVLEVDLDFYEGDTHPSFPKAYWDAESGRLIGESIWNGTTTGQVTRHLTCSGFYFAETSQNFVCNFWTDRTAIDVITLGPAEPVNP